MKLATGQTILLRTGAAALAAALIMSSHVASAQDPTPATPPAAPTAGATSEPSADAVQRARVHYERGIQLFNEENLDAAAAEFARAYDLAPSYKLLYNMAVIQRQQNNYVLALQNYRRYLDEGGANIPPDRRADVEKEISLLKPRVAQITVHVNVDGATLYLDDTPVCGGTIGGRDCVGVSPLPGPVLVNPGRHKIIAQKRGYVAGTALVAVVGSDSTSANIEMIPMAQKEVPVDPAPRNRAIVAWSATALLAGASAVTGVLALNAQSKLNDDKNNVYADGNTPLSSDSKKVKTFALVSDITGGVAVVGALVSVYFTIKAVRAGREAERQRQETGVQFDVSPMGGMIYGRF